MSSTRTPKNESPAAPNRASLRSSLLNVLLRKLPLKRQWMSAEAVRDRVWRNLAQPRPLRATGLGRGVTARFESRGHWPVYHVAPSFAEPGSRVVFLHGGGYVDEIVPAHWRFVGHLAREARARCVVPIFPRSLRSRPNSVYATFWSDRRHHPPLRTACKADSTERRFCGKSPRAEPDPELNCRTSA
jgi:epsilon-lactone hydrolase